MGRIVVQMAGFTSDAGVARLAMFDDRLRRFIATAPIVGGRAEYVFEGMEPGEYAVSVFHDADGDGDLDSDEGVASLERSRVSLRGEEVTMTLEINER